MQERAVGERYETGPWLSVGTGSLAKQLQGLSSLSVFVWRGEGVAAFGRHILCNHSLPCFVYGHKKDNNLQLIFKLITHTFQLRPTALPNFSHYNTRFTGQEIQTLHCPGWGKREGPWMCSGSVPFNKYDLIWATLMVLLTQIQIQRASHATNWCTLHA